MIRRKGIKYIIAKLSSFIFLARDIFCLVLSQTIFWIQKHRQRKFFMAGLGEKIAKVVRMGEGTKKLNTNPLARKRRNFYARELLSFSLKQIPLLQCLRKVKVIGGKGKLNLIPSGISEKNRKVTNWIGNSSLKIYFPFCFPPTSYLLDRICRHST